MDIDIFSQPDYYPTPSENVIKYTEPSTWVENRRKIVSQSDIIALIIYLSSPIDPIDYTIFADFFLIYRNFISPIELHQLLISRFRWCINEIIDHDASNGERKKIGEIALVRTFVLIRHSLLNHYIQDFLQDYSLRLQVIKFLNNNTLYQNCPTIVRSSIINLKKAWIYSSKLAWDNVSFDEPNSIGKDAWLLFEIKDILQLQMMKRRESRLSQYAIQGTSSPDFRNRSVLSLYKTSDNFKLPDVKNKKATPSMLFSPTDNSKGTSYTSSGKSIASFTSASGDLKDTTKKVTTSDLTKTSHISKLDHMSTVIKDIEYPTSPAINAIIPPTPAKKVEFILKSSYFPEVSGIETESPSSIQDSKQSLQGTTSSSLLHRSALGLLNKWKKNHNHNYIHTSHYKNEPKTHNKHLLQRNNPHVQPDIDNFVKYVISITSLEKTDKTKDSEQFSNLLESKFDILSARTIDEVEYLLTLQNELLNKVDKNTIEINADSEKHEAIISSEIENDNEANTAHTKLKKPADTDFSAMDNLDLYQTVSSIAQSVISLSNILNTQTAQLNSPSLAALERRRIKSSLPILGSPSTLNFKTRSRVSLDDSPIKETSPLSRNNGPQRLVFHGPQDESTSTTDGPKFNYSPTKPLRTSHRSSPLKNMLPDFNDDSSGYDLEENESFVSTVSYDSKLSSISVQFKSPRRPKNDALNGTLFSRNDHSNTNEEPILKKKKAHNNLKEFTFEASKLSLPNMSPRKINKSQSLVAVSHGNDSAEEIVDTLSPLNKIVSQTIIRPASGRISISRNPMGPLSHKRKTFPSSPNIISNRTFEEREKSLIESEQELVKLEEETAKRISHSSSVATSRLFSSPERYRGNLRLSVTPSINSIVGGSTLNSTEENLDPIDDDEDSFYQSPQKGKPLTLREQFNKPSSSLISEDIATGNEIDLSNGMANKYLFTPDDDESLDIASPEKDVEVLKNKFLNTDGNHNSSANNVGNDLDSTITSTITNTPAKVDKINGLDYNKLNDIANMPDDSIHEDPVAIAMMKLEGTYEDADADEKNGNKVNGLGETPSVTALIKQVENLNIMKIPAFPKSPIEKRRSLLIERRRQTIMNIPITPTGTLDEAGNISTGQLNENNSVTPQQVQDLIDNYEIKDISLKITNHQHHIPFILMHDSLSIAEQMTLIEEELLCEIDWKDLLELKIEYKGPPVTSWLQLLIRNESLSGIDLAISRFNLTVDWIISEIVLTTDMKLRRNTIQRFIHVAEHCRIFQNYNTLMEIVLALSSTIVQKFTEAWRLIEPGDLLTWEKLKEIPSLHGNYSTIRNLLNSVDPMKGCIPFIVVYLSDLSLNSQKHDWIVEDKIINYNKFQTNVQIVKNFIQRVQWSKFYDFKVDHELLSKCVYITTLTRGEIDQMSMQAP
ncbi:mitotic regulator LTE1 NDAI_0H02550 [Naumovozyma dairenensis CBS 421]|uniref:Guanine nucleotide exchange factor LTE1 n=1 Tax=Naumovozyma dairenensis (strain ATCC 10597 / BCRC 20456 / CBS 421 / NBRC 0211 / NRRL Y-12639) TaxID=1071378 RepID=G0WF68_NAUDC|nr:hypothetical protein NDAI_0H02550 [Naumovozyma dairenensis CBS 421]CCD26429.1 hypothetical protein NDAI_0H02550 [Naumovozyma dairenensis CBS 421]